LIYQLFLTDKSPVLARLCAYGKIYFLLFEVAMTIQNINSVELRNALGQFPTGITIVTTLTHSKERVGMTANSFNSVSLNPPLVLWSIRKESANYNEFVQAEYFAIHILAANQQAISNQFAQKDSDRFINLECSSGINDIPILPDFAACFQCSIEHHYEGGDHTILVGRIIDFENRDQDPLLFLKGNYAKLA
jgi:flavin reductase (DIM6/NTAB) family NADH-FMN oxidoreductase RutF